MDCPDCNGTGWVEKDVEAGFLTRFAIKLLFGVLGILAVLAVISSAESMERKILYVVPIVVLFVLVELEIVPEAILKVFERKRLTLCGSCREKR